MVDIDKLGSGDMMVLRSKQPIGQIMVEIILFLMIIFQIQILAEVHQKEDLPNPLGGHNGNV